MSPDFYKTMFCFVHHLLACVYSRPLFISVVTTHHTATWLYHGDGTMVHDLSLLSLPFLPEAVGEGPEKGKKIKKTDKKELSEGIIKRGAHFLSFLGS